MTTDTTGSAPTTGMGEPRRLFRSRTDRMFAGVCGGIAETYGSDPTAVRLLAAIIGVLTGIFPMLLVYIVAAILIPERGEGDPLASTSTAPRVDLRGQGWLIVGLGLIVGGAAALANEVLVVDWELVWPIALIALGGVVVLGAIRR